MSNLDLGAMADADSLRLFVAARASGLRFAELRGLPPPIARKQSVWKPGRSWPVSGRSSSMPAALAYVWAGPGGVLLVRHHFVFARLSTQPPGLHYFLLASGTGHLQSEQDLAQLVAFNPRNSKTKNSYAVLGFELSIGGTKCIKSNKFNTHTHIPSSHFSFFPESV